jgi:ATP-dependent Lon protease
VPKE